MKKHSRVRRITPAVITVIGTGLSLTDARTLFAGLVVLSGGLLLMYISVVIPAIWSTNRTRRSAAMRVLREIRRLLRGDSPD